MHGRIGLHGAGEGVLVIIRFLVEARAGSLGWARTGRATGVRSLDVEVVVPEGAVGGLAVDVGAIVPNCRVTRTKCVAQIVFEHGDTLKALYDGELQGDAATCGLVRFVPI